MTNSEFPHSWLTCTNLREWRDWLSANHRRESEVWLLIRKVGSDRPGISLSEAVTEALRFGWIDGKARSLDEHGYLIRLTPRKSGSLWSKINRDRAETLIAEGQMTEAGLEKVREAQSNGRWQSAYSSLEEPVTPQDLADALRAIPEAERAFEIWSNSERLQAVMWVGDAKRPGTRKRRIDEIVDRALNNRPMSE